MPKILIRNNYKIVPINNLRKEDQLKVLNIRNNKNIKEWMLNNDLINKKEHLNWIKKLEKDNSQIYFVILDNKACPSGVINLKNIDNKNKSAELGFYKSYKIKEKGLMTLALYSLINYSFISLGLEKLYSEVIQNNIKSINIHKKLLFKEEGYLRSHILRNGERIGIYLFGLLKDEWFLEREIIDKPINITITISTNTYTQVNN